jgi:hypothetical protein
MSSLERSDAHRAAEYVDLARRGETSGATDQGEGGPTATGAGPVPPSLGQTPHKGHPPGEG